MELCWHSPPRNQHAWPVGKIKLTDCHGAQGFGSNCCCQPVGTHAALSLPSLFSCTSVLDSMLFTPFTLCDRNVQEILREEIVNPLRK